MASPTTNFTVVNMNTGANSKSNAEQRTGTIRDILTSKCPTLGYVQEFTWKTGLHGRVFKGYNIHVPTYYEFFGNEDSGFICDNRNIACQHLDYETSVRRTYEKSISEQNSDTESFDLPRLCLCKIKSKRPPEFELLCACWHGPHNNFSDKRKERHLRSLLKFLLKMKVECGNLPLLLGGDFNLGSSKVKRVCGEISGHLVMSPPSSPNSIMLWIHSDDFVQEFNVLSSDCWTTPAFDHAVLKMELQISTTVEDLKRLVPWYGNGGSPITDKTEDFEYHLDIKRTMKLPELEILSASWHGAYAEYSDEAKEESLRWTIRFLLDQINKRYPMIQNNLSLKAWRLKDAPIMNNIHSNYNTLDTWVLSNNEGNLKSQVQRQTLTRVEWVLPPTTPQGQQETPGDVEIVLDLTNVNIPCFGKWDYTVKGYLKKKTSLPIQANQ